MGAAGEDVRARCEAIARRAAAVRKDIARLSGGARNELLREMAGSLRAALADVLAANERDMEAGGGQDAALRDRLRLDAGRIEQMAQAVEAIARQDDPVGRVEVGRVLENGARLEKRRVPLGVVLVIYESRPNVTSDAAALCFKAGNAVILKGGREAKASNEAIVRALRGPLEARGLGDAVQLVPMVEREAVAELVRQRGLVDLVVPRGGPGLIKAVSNAATIPVVKHDAGNCHIYIDAHLESLVEHAVEIVVNAKAQRPGVCNAVETLLVHEAVAGEFLPKVAAALRDVGVELRGDARTCELVPWAKAASEEDWATEYLALVLAVGVVKSLEEAAAHVERYGSKHTEAIVTSNIESAQRFVALCDSASVMVNCSTRFADGGMYGLGAEIGISTDKLHARGPMGAADLTTFQWVLTGQGQVRP